MSNTNLSPTQAIRNTLILGACAILSFLALFFYTQHSVDSTKSQLISLQKSILTASNDMLMMRRHEKDFIDRVDPIYLEKMEADYQNILEQLGSINATIINSGLNTDYDGQQALSYVDDYVQRFYLMADIVLLIHGSEDETGLIDNLKQKALAFEYALTQANSTPLDYIALTTKDLMYQFFAEFEPTVLPRIERTLVQMQSEISAQYTSYELLSKFQEFRLAFYTLQSAYENFGYSYQEGQLGELRATIHKLEGKLNTLFNVLPKQINNEIVKHENHQSLATILLITAIILILLYVVRQTSSLEKQLIDAREHEKQANRAKSAFLANMSHEIRTPLNGILGMTEILGDSKLSAIQRDYLTTINASSQTLLMLINDILDLSKIESGHLEICPHTTAIKETIFDTAALIAPKAQQKQLDIFIDIDADIPDYVKADEQKVRQTLMNLASNAIKFTEKGSITFSLQLRAQKENSVTIGFSIQDTGIGIDEEKQKHVFEEFKQEDADTSKDYGGTGLGLAICAKMVEMMGGSIHLDSIKGKGCHFYFDLEFSRDSHSVSDELSLRVQYFSDSPNPLLISELKRYGVKYAQAAVSDINTLQLTTDTIIILDSNVDFSSVQSQFKEHDIVLLRDNKEAADTNNLKVSAFLTSPLFGNRLINSLRNLKTTKTPSELTSSNDTNPEPKRTFRILVVEDNKVNQQIVSLNLKKLSIDFVIANNGQEAVEVYQRDYSSIGLILMDCMMPVLDGFEATKAIREFEAENDLKQTHIIALTASVLDDDIQKCYQSGMDDYLPKPFKREVLMEKLDSKFQASL
ncbi:ATP-binding protein [Vibrio mediterranei]